MTKHDHAFHNSAAPSKEKLTGETSQVNGKEKTSGCSQQERFSLDENEDVIDALNPVRGLQYYYSDCPSDQWHLRESILRRRLDVLVDELIINRQPEETDLLGGSYQPPNYDAHAIANALFDTIRAAALNTVAPAVGMKNRFAGSLKRDKAILQQITSLWLFRDDVECLLRDLYGDVDCKALDEVLIAIHSIAVEFTRYVRKELAEEHAGAMDWDYISGVGLPDGYGLSSSDHRRAHRALDALKERVREVRKNPARHSKYTVEFASRFSELIVMDVEVEANPRSPLG